MSGVRILLDDNRLTGLNPSVFQQIINYFKKNNIPIGDSYISISKSIKFYNILSPLPIFKIKYCISYYNRFNRLFVRCLLQQHRLDRQ